MAHYSSEQCKWKHCRTICLYSEEGNLFILEFYTWQDTKMIDKKLITTMNNLQSH